MSRPVFLNPFARGAEKAGQLGDEDMGGRRDLTVADASSDGAAALPAPGRRTEPRQDFLEDDLALALLSSRPEPRSFLPLGPTVRSKTATPSQQVDPATYDTLSLDAQDNVGPSEETGRARKVSFMLGRRGLAPRPLLQKVVDFLRPAATSSETRRNQLRDLLQQNSGPKPLGLTRPRARGPTRPPRPPSIDAEVLDLMSKFPSPVALASGQDAARNVVVVSEHVTQVSIRPSIKHSYPDADFVPLPPAKVDRVGGSLPALPHIRQKIGVAPDLRGRPRRRREDASMEVTYWEVLQYNKLRIPPASHSKWMSAGVLGQGGFGTVFLVYNVVRRAQCAMKVVHYARGMSETCCYGMINELKVLSRLAEEANPSPFVLRPFVGDELWAWRSAGQYLHIVTDYCAGGDLSHYQHKLTDYHLSLICAEVILGLDYLHRLGIVHHDIKPANILVNAAGHVVISDYGGAQFLGASGRIPRSQRNMAVMTIPFAAPELLSENDSAYPTYDEAVDYWSLGATLVSLLMNDDLLPGAHDISLMTFRIHRIEKRMCALGVSERLRHFVMALLEMTPSKRPRYPEVAELPFFQYVEWDAVKELRSPPFDFVKEIGVLAHGFPIPTALIHETRNPVDLLHRLRREQLSLVVDDSFDVESHKAGIVGRL